MPVTVQEGVRLFEYETLLTAGRREQTLNSDRLGNENELLTHAARDFNKIPSDMR
jgi:hypothetical protein